MRRLLFFIVGMMLLAMGCTNESLAPESPLTNERPAVFDPSAYDGGIKPREVSGSLTLISCEDGKPTVEVSYIITHEGVGEMGIMIGTPDNPTEFHSYIVSNLTEGQTVGGLTITGEPNEDLTITINATGNSVRTGFKQFDPIPAEQCQMNR